MALVGLLLVDIVLIIATHFKTHDLYIKIHGLLAWAILIINFSG
jgi:hypothetical protein